MTRFYLHLRDRSEEVLDPEGLELVDLDAVKRAVLAGARDMIANEIKTEGLIDLRYRIDAENEAGEVVHSLPFKGAVHIIPELA
jgi:hypothetical protein